ncbi:MAG: AI-2E family transporter [Clostridiales Family XIII bacterium]|jgi:predicted PurR-regulated permease PerM|nr:AI-2E family transporter [Clostridiales Family XIII bacterium]
MGNDSTENEQIGSDTSSGGASAGSGATDGADVGLSSPSLMGSGKAYKVVISVIVLAAAFTTFWFMMDLVILTFILTFVFYHFQKVIERGFARLAKGIRIPNWLSLVVVYIVGLTAVVMFAWGFTTVIVDQAREIARAMEGFDINSMKSSLDARFLDIINKLDIGRYINTAVENLGKMLLDLLQGVGEKILHFVMSVVISFLFLIERDNIKRFGAKASESRIGFIYNYFITFGGNFCRTFGKVMKVQVTIALVNSLLSTLLLHFFGMPHVWGLGLMIFALGLIPVAGVVISIIPLCIIAFNTGGFFMIVKILIMVVVLHAVEAYVLNPKLMAHRTALPVSFVFVILIVAERYLSFWGLLIGVPLFIFLTTIFQIDYEEACKQPPSRIMAKIRSLYRSRTAKGQ